MKKKNLLSVLLILALVAALGVSALGASDGSTMQTAVDKYLSDMRATVDSPRVTFGLPEVEAALEWDELEVYNKLPLAEKVMVAFGIYDRLTENEIAGLSEEAAGLIEKTVGRLTRTEGKPVCLTVAPYVNRIMQTNFHIVLASAEEDGDELLLDGRDGLVLLRSGGKLNVIRVKLALDVDYDPPRAETVQPTATPSAAPSYAPTEAPSTTAPAPATTAPAPSTSASTGLPGDSSSGNAPRPSASSSTDDGSAPEK